MSKVAVIGAGSWGSVLANILVMNGHKVYIWSRRKEQVDELNKQHTNRHYLANFTYDKRLVASVELEKVLDDATMVLFAIPTKAMRTVTADVASILNAKGLSNNCSRQ